MKANCRRFFLLLALFAAVHPKWAPAANYNLAIAPAGQNKFVVSWPVAANNYVLQSTLNLAAPNWLTITNPPPVVVNNANTVTYTNNSLTRFFRLFLNPSGYYLAITTAGNNFIISWPAAATNYVLQSTISLSPASWLTITNPAPVTLNNTNFVTYTNNSLTRFFRLSLNTNTSTANPYPGMVLIPAGTFTMGNSIGADTDITDANPTNVTVSAFYMDTNLVSYSLWQSVYGWAASAGYGFENSGAGKGPNHPVQTVDWYNAVKWCNARSQQAGLTPVYYTDAGLTQVYTNGEISSIYVNWTTTGYRLPTEAEWEKAARGGLSGKRFPLANTISESQANYYGDTTLGYDFGPDSWNTAFFTGGQPYTSPVGSFPPNGYGLFDMAGNLCEWCWDWYGTPYAGGTDPHGPDSGGNRALRGGYWGWYATSLRCADRNQYLFTSSPSYAYNGNGFRCVRTH